MSGAKAVQDSNSYLKLLKRSELLSEEELQQATTLAGKEADPRSYARQLVKRQLLTTWQATQLLAGWHGLTIGKYKLCSQLAKSEVGRVFLAEHAQMGRQVALKTLSRRFTSQPEIVEQFLSDARSVAALDHRNLVHVYDVDGTDDRYVLVMEHVSGRDLQAVVSAEGPLEPARAADYVRQAARGLAYAHEREVLHGDLKPANLMVDEDGVVKVLSLGLAHISHSSAKMPHASAKPGASSDDGPSAEPAAHPELVAPELRDGDVGFSAGGDVYALGAAFYYLLTGKLPTVENGARDLLRRRPELPKDLARICARMMASDPAKRFKSAGDAESALDVWLAENAPEPIDDVELEDDSASSDVVDLMAADDQGESPRKTPAKGLRRAKPLPSVESSSNGNGVAVTDASNPSPSPAVQTGRRKKKKGSDAKANASVAGSASKPFPVALIVGGGAGAILVLGLVAALLFVLFGSNGGAGRDVAQTDPNATDAAAVGAGDNLETDDLEADDLESDPEDSLESDPVDPLKSDPADDAGGAGNADDQPGDNGAPAENGGQAATNDAAPSGDGVDGGIVAGENGARAGTDDAASAAKPATDDAATDSGPDGNETDAGDAAKTDAADDAAKPKPPEPKPPAKPKPKPVKPFAGLAKTVSLPELGDGSSAIELGPVRVPEDLICFMKLRGGKDAVKGTPGFSMRNANDGTSETEWEIFLTGSRSGGELKVADLKLEENKLKFQWTADAASESQSAHLANCALSMNVGADAHDLVLRKPTTITPITLDLEKPAATQKLSLSLPPEPTSIRIQLLKLEGPFPPHVIEPDSAYPVVGGEQKIKLGKTPNEQVLELRVKTAVKRDVQVTVSPYFRWALDKNPVKLTRVTARKAEQGATLARAQIVAKLDQLKQFEKRDKETARRQGITAQISLGEQQLQKVESGIQAVQTLKSQIEALHKEGMLKFRIFYDAEGTEVELARSE